MWRKGWLMKISEAKQWEGREREKGSDCEWSHRPHTSFVKKLRCAQCRWGVWLLESEEGNLRTRPVTASEGREGGRKRGGEGWGAVDVTDRSVTSSPR